MVVLKYFKELPSTGRSFHSAQTKLKKIVGDNITNIKTEQCFYVNVDDDALDYEDECKVIWILETPFKEKKLSRKPFLKIDEVTKNVLFEIGPRLNFSTPFSTNAVSMCRAAGLKMITRIEYSTRYLLHFVPTFDLQSDLESQIVKSLHDRMTECLYRNPVESFALETKTEEIYEVDVLKDGRHALEKANIEMGLAFDDWDLDYYTKLFQDKIQRNPTNVECFDLAQSNSEHSRHWFFRGRLFVDDEEYPESLFKMIMSTQEHTNKNNVIKFSDNSSAIKGFNVKVVQPSNTSEPSIMEEREAERHIIFTAETHNFPTGVAPFPGATTGTGGRIRDVQATGRGAHVVAGTAGYSFGSLHIPGYLLPWEEESSAYPSNFASPLDIAIEASNGASDYGNKFGEPVLAGFSRSFGLTLPDGDRREYIKPIMFSGGIGQMDGCHVTKIPPKEDMEVVKIGGPVYRIGVGGGAASSVQVQGDNKEELDFGAVQRGDAEMEQKMNRLIRACIERGQSNPIASIHDQGAGGNGNVLKEIAEPAGALIKSSHFQLGDPTISLLELWGAEYQESNAVLVKREDKDVLMKIGERERCPVSFVGRITGDGKIKLENFPTLEGDGSPAKKRSKKNFPFPVDLELEHVLGSMPRKEFKLERQKKDLKPLTFPENLTLKDALDRVLRLPSVASKRYLTSKVDRCVTGLVGQQQCVGPLHTPLADVAVTALSYFDKVGSATAIGEQPVKGLIDPGCMARMSVGEALTNLVFARITDLKDVKCSGNWMWPAKLPGEGAALLDACTAMCDIMKKLGIAVDGGKDSLSMAARVGDKTVKAPGTLVISVYAGCPDITATVTPDLKCPEGQGCLMYVDLSCGQHRLGGSSLAHCFRQIGNTSPDLDHPDVFTSAFNVTQQLIKDRKLISGHDVSDGGLITCLLEMAFAGNCGIDIDISSESEVSFIDILFAEELGLVLEVSKGEAQHVMDAYSAVNTPCKLIGHSVKQNKEIKILVNKRQVLKEDMTVLRDVWEETSFQLENYQTDKSCVLQEQKGLKERLEPPYHVPFESEIISFVPRGRPASISPIKVAVLREEGSNSDREMAAVLHMAGFEVWDVNMQDMCSGKITLDQFQGVVFVGGFSYADVCGSAKGWAATILYNQNIREQFLKFRERSNTFSLGVCNGCQLMGLLGWVAQDEDQKENTDSGVGQGVLLDHNDSGRFECRYVTVKIQTSPSIMLRGMEDTVFGIWSAHGEGKMVFKSPDIQRDVLMLNLAPVRYVDDQGNPTTIYPFNPNGSPDGIAALCSEDGRHLAIMPHPERCFLPWQCPWMPLGMREKLDVSPWYKMFQNAFDWCVEHV